VSEKDPVRLVIISGVSGSGKSTALKAFEDIGYFCLDNLPAPLVEHFVNLILNQVSKLDSDRTTADHSSGSTEERNHYALLVDCRDNTSVNLIQEAINRLSKAGVDVCLLFLECQDDAALTRYRQTRRPHPLLQSSNLLKTIAEALEKERELLSDLRALANLIIDTTSYSPHDLRKRIEEYDQYKTDLELAIISFGFKYGVPNDIDLLVDVRFLPNPYYVENLRPLIGTDPRIVAHVFSSPDADQFVTRYYSLLEFLIPKYQEEGKRYMTLAVGCTGGKHRSVAISERLAVELRTRDQQVSLSHRDTER